MVDLLIMSCRIGDLTATGGQGFANGHYRLDDVVTAGISFQPPLMQGIVGFQH